MVHLRARQQSQGLPDGVIGGQMGERQHIAARLAAGVLKVVEEAGQLEVASHLAGHHLGAHAPLAYQKSRPDQLVHGLPHGGPGQAELRRQIYLVVQLASGGKGARADGGFDPLSYLMVERHRRGAIDVEPQRVH